MQTTVYFAEINAKDISEAWTNFEKISLLGPITVRIEKQEGI